VGNNGKIEEYGRIYRMEHHGEETGRRKQHLLLTIFSTDMLASKV